MTDLPYGRGGSPLQHLILRGHRATKLSALRLVGELDAGPLYAKADLSLEGRAEAIYERAMDTAAELIAAIVRDEPEPRPQPMGPASVFRRRKPEESRLPELASPEAVYDFIRMLDAPGYPHAFLSHGSFRFTFSHAELENGAITARVCIEPEPEAAPPGGLK
jgi:methionyl-tRNA formyltransferase